MKDLSIHILTTHKNKDRQKSILDSWLQGFDDYVFYTDLSTSVGNQIPLTKNDGYESGGEKQILELYRIASNGLHNNFNWFFFCDDDSVINIKKLIDYSKNIKDKLAIGKIIYCFGPDPTLGYFQGGAGFLLHSSLFRNSSIPIIIPGVPWSDVHAGIWLRQNNVRLHHDELFNEDPPEKCGKVSSDLMKKQISFHYIKTRDEMIRIDNIFKS